MISVERVFREKRSIMMPLLIGLAVNVALLLFAVLPLTRSVASEEARSVQAAADRADAEQAFARAQAIVTGKTRADRELARFYGQVLPRDFSSARRAIDLPLNQLARAAGVRVESSTAPEPPETEDSRLRRMTFEYRLSGDYRAIRRLIHSIESQPGFIVIDNVELATGQGEPLAVTVRVSTYFAGANGG